MPKIVLKIALLEDEAFLMKLRNDNKRFFFDIKPVKKNEHHKWFLERLEKDLIFIVYLGKQRIGTISLVDYREEDTTIMLGRFIIQKSFRNRGFGHQIMKKFKKICEKKATQKIILDVKKNNKNALDFYIKEGFYIIEEQKILMETYL